MDIRRLEGSFGAQVRGADIASGLDDDALVELSAALYRHRVLCIRDQHLSKEQYLAFGRRWGAPIPHVLDHMRMPGFPELLVVGNTEEKDKDVKIRNGAALWHTDQSYEKVPASATMLLSIKAPREGGETQFCDMAAAYASLDDDVKQTVRGLDVGHKYGRGKLRDDDLAVNPIVNDKQDARVPVTYHPLVMCHPVIGTPALYALGHGAHAVKGMREEDAGALLDSLKTHALSEQHIYRHRYEVGDLVIWDTLQTMHRATPIDLVRSEDNARLLWRISVRGRPDFLR